MSVSNKELKIFTCVNAYRTCGASGFNDKAWPMWNIRSLFLVCDMMKSWIPLLENGD